MPWSSPSADGPPYRRLVSSELEAWRVLVGESDLLIGSERSARDAVAALVGELRARIERFAIVHPSFLVGLEPFALPPGAAPPPGVVKAMIDAAAAAGVGPMAAVAGAIAEAVARFLGRSQPEAIVENGGDTFILSRRRRVCAIYAGASAFSMRIGIALSPDRLPCSVCTSSGTVGPSLSFGAADAGVVVAASGALADAMATALANRVQGPADLEGAVSWAAAQPGVAGAVAVAGSSMAVKGEIELVEL